MRTFTRRVRSKWDGNERAYGVTIQMPSAEAVEIAGYTGYDFVWIDAEHGTLDLGDINTLVRAADAVGIDAIVRVPDRTSSFIQRVLDTGATGIIVPHTSNVAVAQAIVAASKYEPEGTRGACPATRAVGHYTQDWIADYRRANRDTLVFGLIEDPEGVDNVTDIAAVNGLDGLVFGPFDLAMALGLEGDVTHPHIDAARTKVIDATRRAGIEFVALAGFGSGGLAAAVASSGSRIINVTGDRGILVTVMQAQLDDIKNSLDSELAERR